jgi:hypothetical protein
MKTARAANKILRVASLLAPAPQRVEWLQEWQSELWYVPPHEATRFSVGAFRDALWLRRNNLRAAENTAIHPESPITCLAFLAAISALGISIAVCLPAPRDITSSAHLGIRDLLEGSIAMLLFTALILPAALAVGRVPANRLPVSWPARFRGGMFLALKIALVQPLMLCGFLFWIATAQVLPFVQLGILAAWFLALRWVFTDQRRRCPVCLHMLTDPVRIGTSSQTFLEWYGGESMCSRGHGLLQVPGVSASSSERQKWLSLDNSWSGLFPAVPKGSRHDT